MHLMLSTHFVQASHTHVNQGDSVVDFSGIVEIIPVNSQLGTVILGFFPYRLQSPRTGPDSPLLLGPAECMTPPFLRAFWTRRSLPFLSFFPRGGDPEAVPVGGCLRPFF